MKPQGLSEILLAILAAGLSVLVILAIPLVPNWPFVFSIGTLAAALFGVIYYVLVMRQLRSNPPPTTSARLIRIFPIWVAAGAFASSYVRMTSEDRLCLEFQDGVVVKKYQSRNHAYLSAQVQAPDGRQLEVEGISLDSWDRLTPGMKVGKRCGARDITIETE